jgi:hypothetical protein
MSITGVALFAVSASLSAIDSYSSATLGSDLSSPPMVCRSGLWAPQH